MTCDWEGPYGNNDPKQVTWERKTSTDTEYKQIWTLIIDHFLVMIGNEVHPDFTGKILQLENQDYSKGHNVRLLDISKDDEGEYRCIVDVMNSYEFPSDSRKLNVYGKLIHCTRSTLFMNQNIM